MTLLFRWLGPGALAFLFALAASPAWSQGAQPPARLDLGRGFSVDIPAGDGWRSPPNTPGIWGKLLESPSHSMVYVANLAASGVTREELQALGGPNAADELHGVLARFARRALKAQAADVEQARYEKLELVADTGKAHSLDGLFCAWTRSRVHDRERQVQGQPLQLRLVIYSCVGVNALDVVVNVSYSERGLDGQLSDALVAEGERWAHSLRRAP